MSQNGLLVKPFKANVRALVMDYPKHLFIQVYDAVNKVQSDVGELREGYTGSSQGRGRVSAGFKAVCFIIENK